MKISVLSRFLFCAFVATALSLTAAAQTASGQIKAAKVDGLVTKISADGTQTPLKSGDSLSETDAVLTGKSGTVVLVFSNGSSVKVGSSSRLAIDEFKMDPLAEDVRPAELKNEPSVSKTTLNLAYGEMVGDVKKLNKSSSYSIKTPVGAAGIRGTVYRIVFTPDPTNPGKSFFHVQTLEGSVWVTMEGGPSGTVPVDAGKEVTVEVDTDKPADSNTIVPQDLTPENKAVIEDASKTIMQAVFDTVIPPPTSSSSTEKKNDPPPADTDPVPPPPQTTSGAGG